MCVILNLNRSNQRPAPHNVTPDAPFRKADGDAAQFFHINKEVDIFSRTNVFG